MKGVCSKIRREREKGKEKKENIWNSVSPILFQEEEKYL
jgi:hypothetical protein